MHKKLMIFVSFHAAKTQIKRRVDFNNFPVASVAGVVAAASSLFIVSRASFRRLRQEGAQGVE
jgi:hypothetical protein